MPTPRQQALARILESDPPPLTYRAALAAAGYSKETADNGRRQAELAGTRLARDAIRAEKLNTAKELRRRAQGRLGPAIDQEDDAVRLSQVALAMAKVEEAVPDSAEAGLIVKAQHIARASERLRACYLAGARAVLDGHVTPILAPLLASRGLLPAAPAAPLTQGALEDASHSQ